MDIITLRTFPANVSFPDQSMILACTRRRLRENPSRLDVSKNCPELFASGEKQVPSKRIATSLPSLCILVLGCVCV